MARGRANQDTNTGDTAVDTQPEFASVGGNGNGDDDEPDRSGRVRPVKRARVGVVVLAVLLTEVVLIAAGVNQGVARQLQTYATDHPSSLLGHFVRSLLLLRWSVSASGHTDLWHTELITVGLVLLLGIVVVPMVVHGPVSWLRAFLGTWFTVTVSVCVAVVAALVLADLEESRDLTQYVIPGTPASGLSVGDKIGDATFGPVLSYAVVAGLALGLVVAFVTATLVAATRQTDPVPVAAAPESRTAYAPETPQPFFGSADDDRSARTTAYGTARYADSHPYADPDRRAADNPTTTIPAVGGGYAAGYGSASTATADTGTTTGSDTGTTTGSNTAAGGDQRLSGFDRALGATPSTPSGTTPPAESTAQLPRTEAVPATSEPETPATTDDTPTDEHATGTATEPTQAWPAQPEPDSTAAFPLPPDDEDIEHQPYHNED